MLASILISARFGAKEHPINKLIVGLLILGITGLFYINPMLLPIKEIFAHVFNSLGLLFILLGLSELPDLESSLRVKDKLAANLSLLLILFYVVFISLISASLKIIFPQDLKKVFNNLEINFSNVERYIKNYSLEGTPIKKLFNDLNIKSMYSFPINYEGKLLGYLILQYKKDYKKMSTDDLSFLEKMAKQIGIAMKDKK